MIQNFEFRRHTRIFGTHDRSGFGGSLIGFDWDRERSSCYYQPLTPRMSLLTPPLSVVQGIDCLI